MEVVWLLLWLSTPFPAPAFTKEKLPAGHLLHVSSSLSMVTSGTRAPHGLHVSLNPEVVSAIRP